MDKNAIKKYAVWARRELKNKVSFRASIYGITEKEIKVLDTALNGEVLNDTQKKQRDELIHLIKEYGYEAVMEEAAYTWFNRFCAIRFMEANNYLPSHVRIFTDDNGEFYPQIMNEVPNVDIATIETETILDLKINNQNDELFKYLIIHQCNALSDILPKIFAKLEDWTTLLFPDSLFNKISVIGQLVEMIPEEDWHDQVQIIGWLYESYNTENNALVYDGTFSREKISKELISAATTMYTPDWPVRYMVENSLGKIYIEGHPNEELKSNWKYYLNETIQDEKVESALSKIRNEYKKISIEGIKCIDPCCGSGHILCYMFDVLMEIYSSEGYSPSDAVRLILENNLFGLDIDKRASQLAYFSVMMKARQYDGRFFRHVVFPNVYAITESNHFSGKQFEYFTKNNQELISIINIIRNELYDVSEYGSIITPSKQDWNLLDERISELEIEDSTDSHEALKLKDLIKTAELLSNKYHVVVTNPPYMGNGRFNSKLDFYIKKHYKDEKADLSMVMYRKALKDLSIINGFIAFITTSSWMFLGTFEKLRNNIINNVSIDSLVDFGTELFEGKVGHNPTVAWVTRNSFIDYRLNAIRLVDFCYSKKNEKEKEFFNPDNRYTIKQSDFSKIPKTPIAYWVSRNFINAFDNLKLEDFATLSEGIHTRDNDQYLRLWYEVNNLQISFNGLQLNKKWYPLNKGGSYRKWYGNNEYVVNWENNGESLKQSTKASIGDVKNHFKEGITFTVITSGERTFRYSPEGMLYDMAGPTLFTDKKYLYYILSIFSSKVGRYFLNAINPGVSLKLSEVKLFPILFKENLNEKITSLVQENIQISKEDWDSFETSWDFVRHPLVPMNIGEDILISDLYDIWKDKCDKRFFRLKHNEEELNKIFIDIYNLQDELSFEVEDKYVSVRRADLNRDIKSLLSFIVGCAFGRYSLDSYGICYAGGEWDDSIYKSVIPKKDNVILLSEDIMIEDNIMAFVKEFLTKAYGEKYLRENLRFIASALGKQGDTETVICNYYTNEFYSEHVKIYKGRPIYWLFDSGKYATCRCLSYMHRYYKYTAAIIRIEYVHKIQDLIKSSIKRIDLSSLNSSDRVKASKELSLLLKKQKELELYESKIHVEADKMRGINLDDGIKKNYEERKAFLKPLKKEKDVLEEP